MKVLIDTDPGIDDAAAIFMALGSAEIDVVGMTTVFGNVNIDLTTRNAVHLLDVIGRDDIPVFRGAGLPLVARPQFAPEIHGDDGLGGLAGTDLKPKRDTEDERAVEAIIRFIKENPGEVTLLALGPLTNVALALSTDPTLAENVDRIVYMGGAVLTWGNVTAAASANLYNDAEAAKIVVNSGAPLVQVGLDVCRKSKVPKGALDAIGEASSPAADMLSSAAVSIRDNYETRLGKGRLEGGAFFNDMPCVAYLLQPDLFEERELHVDIETRGELTRGATVADIDGIHGGEPNVTVLMDVDGEAVRHLFERCILAID